jgi:hypothetical protein
VKGNRFPTLALLTFCAAMSSNPASAIGETIAAVSTNLSIHATQQLINSEKGAALAVETKSGSANASSFARFGELHAYADTESFSPFSAAQTSAGALFSDAIRISNPTLTGQTGYIDIDVLYHWNYTVPSGDSGWGVDARVWLDFNFARVTARYLGSKFNGFPEVYETQSPATVSGSAEILGATLGEYFTARYPIVFGVENIVGLNLNLRASATNGMTVVDAANTAFWGGVSVYDSQLVPVEYTITSRTGVNYENSFAPIP